MPTAVIAGATGMIGRAIAQRLAELGGWDVIGLARKPRDSGGMRWIAVDLADADDCRRKLAGLTAVTHLFYAARYDHPEGVPERADTNSEMLRNVVDSLASANALAHVHAVHGSKYYGHHLGPLKMPMAEDHPRAASANFYFTQEDFLRARGREQGFSYTLTRPHAFSSPAADTPRSIGLLVAVYAAIQRELGRPLDFPGSERAFHARTQFTDLRLLARAIAWMATDPRCANQAFNIVNGDAPRWSELWPRFATYFGVPAGSPQPMRLADYMLDKGGVWQAIIRKHGLRPTALDSLVLWPYGNYVFAPEWDIISDMSKARGYGFTETIDSEKMFLEVFDYLRAEKIVP